MIFLQICSRRSSSSMLLFQSCWVTRMRFVIHLNFFFVPLLYSLSDPWCCLKLVFLFYLAHSVSSFCLDNFSLWMHSVSVCKFTFFFYRWQKDPVTSYLRVFKILWSTLVWMWILRCLIKVVMFSSFFPCLKRVNLTVIMHFK